MNQSERGSSKLLQCKLLWQYITRVMARSKDRARLSEFSQHMVTYYLQGYEEAQWVICSLLNNPETLQDCVLCAPNRDIQEAFLIMVQSCLSTIHSQQRNEYAHGMIPKEKCLVYSVLTSLAAMIPTLRLHWRTWSPFFQLVETILEMDKYYTMHLVELQVLPALLCLYMGNLGPYKKGRINIDLKMANKISASSLAPIAKLVHTIIIGHRDFQIAMDPMVPVLFSYRPDENYVTYMEKVLRDKEWQTNHSIEAICSLCHNRYVLYKIRDPLISAIGLSNLKELPPYLALFERLLAPWNDGMHAFRVKELLPPFVVTLSQYLSYKQATVLCIQSLIRSALDYKAVRGCLRDLAPHWLRRWPYASSTSVVEATWDLVNVLFIDPVLPANMTLTQLSDQSPGTSLKPLHQRWANRIIANINADLIGKHKTDRLHGVCMAEYDNNGDNVHPINMYAHLMIACYPKASLNADPRKRLPMITCWLNILHLLIVQSRSLPTLGDARLLVLKVLHCLLDLHTFPFVAKKDDLRDIIFNAFTHVLDPPPDQSAFSHEASALLLDLLLNMVQSIAHIPLVYDEVIQAMIGHPILGRLLAHGVFDVEEDDYELDLSRKIIDRLHLLAEDSVALHSCLLSHVVTYDVMPSSLAKVLQREGFRPSPTLYSDWTRRHPRLMRSLMDAIIEAVDDNLNEHDVMTLIRHIYLWISHISDVPYDQTIEQQEVINIIHEKALKMDFINALILLVDPDTFPELRSMTQ
eukprot:Ihof_evm1s469 gene=Ihof_evmTU1s469